MKNVVRMIGRAHVAELCSAEEASALSDVVWEAMPSSVDLLGAGLSGQFQLLWRGFEAGLRSPADEIDVGTRMRVIYSTVSLLLQVYLLQYLAC